MREAAVRDIGEGRDLKARRLRGEVTRPAASPEPWRTKPWIAEFYGVTSTTIDAWCRDGMPFHQKGPRRKFRVSECEAWQDRR